MTAQAGSASSPLLDRNGVRRAMRQRRRALSPEARRLAAKKIARSLNRLPFVKPGARIAVYLAAGSEVDLASFIALARRRACRLYAPRIVNARQRRMAFFRLDTKTKLHRNIFGIPESLPSQGASIPPQRLDVVLAPLLAFDSHGARLGMGAGYYDRCFSRLRRGVQWRRPKLIGIAYDFQHVPPLDAQPWDVRMDSILTESGLHRALPAAARPT